MAGAKRQGGKLAPGHALVGPQAHQQPLGRRLARRKRACARRARAGRLDAGDIVGDRCAPSRWPTRPPAQRQPAMGAGADAEIVPAAPIGEVVPRAGGRAPRMVGDLVGLEARPRSARPASSRRARGRSPRRPASARRARRRGRRRCRARWSVGRARCARAQARWPRPSSPAQSADALAGPGVDQVDGDLRRRPPAPWPSPAGPGRRRGCGRGRPAPRRRATARPARGGSTPASAKPAKRPASASVGLASSVISTSAVAGQSARAAATISPTWSGVHQRRRAAAEEDRAQPPWAESPPPDPPGRRRWRGPSAGRLVAAARPDHVEVAIGADARAIGPVHIDARAARAASVKTPPPSASRRRACGG